MPANWTKEAALALARKRYGAAAAFIVSFRERNGCLPWAQHHKNALSRCTKMRDPKWKFYGGRGILCLVTLADVRRAWLRDKAWKMDIPSLRRRNLRGNYHRNNICFVEFDYSRRHREIKKGSQKGIVKNRRIP